MRETASDGYHTFKELYDHRNTLFIVLCYIESGDQPFDSKPSKVWRSKLHHDGSFFDGHFILGINRELGEQITYHIPLSRWDETNWADTLDRAPEWDGHTPSDVIKRLQNIIILNGSF